MGSTGSLVSVNDEHASPNLPMDRGGDRKPNPKYHRRGVQCLRRDRSRGSLQQFFVRERGLACCDLPWSGGVHLRGADCVLPLVDRQSRGELPRSA